jgi:hypothetical protein
MASEPPASVKAARAGALGDGLCPAPDHQGINKESGLSANRPHLTAVRGESL